MALKLRLALASLMIAGSVGSFAAELPPIAFLSMGFREVRESDLLNTPQAAKRALTPGGLLRVTADFNGDGTSDEARILQNADRQIAYVVAVIKSPAKIDTYVLSQVHISSVANIGIQTAKPRPDLTKGQSLSGIAVVDLTTGNGEAMYFDGAEFDVRVSIEGSPPSSAA